MSGSPRAFGYLRVPDGADDDQVRATERALREHARDNGLHLVRIVFEFEFSGDWRPGFAAEVLCLEP